MGGTRKITIKQVYVDTRGLHLIHQE